MARAALERASALNPALNAFLQLLPDQALAAARAQDARLARGESPEPLAGIPVALKDNMCLGHEPELGSYGGRTTCASRRGAPDALPVVQVGKYVRFRPADLLEYVDRRSRTAADDLVFPNRKASRSMNRSCSRACFQTPASRVSDKRLEPEADGIGVRVRARRGYGPSKKALIDMKRLFCPFDGAIPRNTSTILNISGTCRCILPQGVTWWINDRRSLTIPTD